MVAASAKISDIDVCNIEAAARYGDEGVEQKTKQTSSLIQPDCIFEIIGNFGRFQQIQLFLICLPIIFVQMHVMSWTFVVEPMEKSSCNGTENFNDTQCNQLSSSYSASDRWEMSGESSWIRAVVQASYFLGQLIGSFLCGIFADKIGRKTVFVFCLLLQVFSALILIFAPTWWLYAITKAFTGFSQPGIYGVAVVLGMELVGKQFRSLISIIANVFCVAGAVILAILAYFIADYRILHAAIAVPSLIFLFYWWLIHESARWLISKQKYDEANLVLKAASKMNKKRIVENWFENVEETKSLKKGVESFGLVDLVRTPQMKKRTLVCFFIWPVTTMMYYGLTLKSDISGGNLFVTFITSSLVEIPAVLVVFLLIDRIGRKPLFSGSILACGLFLLLNWLITDYVPNSLAVGLVLTSKCFVTIAYTAMYTYTSELFPTVIRNTAVGCCSTMARIGAIIVSFISFFLVEKYGKIVMVVPFTILAISSSVISLIFLPETMNEPLPNSISEVEGNMI